MTAEWLTRGETRPQIMQDNVVYGPYLFIPGDLAALIGSENQKHYIQARTKKKPVKMFNQGFVQPSPDGIFFMKFANSREGVLVSHSELSQGILAIDQTNRRTGRILPPGGSRRMLKN